MSKHARPTTTQHILGFMQPKHLVEWSAGRARVDLAYIVLRKTPGKHAKPFGKHHPATPVTAATTANVIALRAAPALNLAA